MSETIKSRKVVAWPPKVGARVCKYLGPANPNNWSGDVRAIVDDEAFVVRKWLRHKRYHRYIVVERLDLEIWNEGRDAPAFFYGGLPNGSR